MKKKLFSFLLLLYFSLSSLALSIEYVNSSKHWSLIKNGPLTIDQAVKMFFEGRKIDKYEGVWTESNWGIVAIVKDGPNRYQKYVIDVGYPYLNGTLETTYYKTANPSHLTFFTRITWKNGNNYKYATSMGDLYYKSSNTLERNINRYALNPYGTFTRNWPLDYYKYNQQFVKTTDNKKKEPKKEVTNQEKPKKKYDRYAPKTNYKNYWWVLILLALGAFFLYTKTVPKPKKIKRVTKSKPTGFKKDLINYWEGRVSYGFSYWVCLTIIGTIIALPSFYFFSDQFIDNASLIVLILIISYALFIFVTQIYLIVGTWRSAEFYKAQKRKLKQSLIWGYLGQISIVLSIISKFAELF